jgi:hypothetical protein
MKSLCTSSESFGQAVAEANKAGVGKIHFLRRNGSYSSRAKYIAASYKSMATNPPYSS